MSYDLYFFHNRYTPHDLGMLLESPTPEAIESLHAILDVDHLKQLVARNTIDCSTDDMPGAVDAGLMSGGGTLDYMLTFNPTAGAPAEAAQRMLNITNEILSRYPELVCFDPQLDDFLRPRSTSRRSVNATSEAAQPSKSTSPASPIAHNPSPARGGNSGRSERIRVPRLDP